MSSEDYDPDWDVMDIEDIEEKYEKIEDSLGNQMSADVINNQVAELQYLQTKRLEYKQIQLIGEINQLESTIRKFSLWSRALTILLAVLSGILILQNAGVVA
jgi:hypothetical protein